MNRLFKGRDRFLVAIGLHEGGRDPQEPGGRDHGAAHVPTGAEDGVGTPTPQDPHAGGGGRQVADERAREIEPRPAGEALDREGVEVEAGRARQPLLNGLRPTGERDERAAVLQRLGDRERGQDVTRRPAGGDQELWRWTRRHG